jgi:hypothetical protein
MSEVDPMAGGSIALSPAAVGGRRHMKKVSAKTIKRTLRKLGMKPKGRVVLKGGDLTAPADGAAGKGADTNPVSTDGASGGRRRRHTKKHSRRHKRGFRLF